MPTLARNANTRLAIRNTGRMVGSVSRGRFFAYRMQTGGSRWHPLHDVRFAEQVARHGKPISECEAKRLVCR